MGSRLQRLAGTAALRTLYRRSNGSLPRPDAQRALFRGAGLNQREDNRRGDQVQGPPNRWAVRSSSAERPSARIVRAGCVGGNPGTDSWLTFGSSSKASAGPCQHGSAASSRAVPIQGTDTGADNRPSEDSLLVRGPEWWGYLRWAIPVRELVIRSIPPGAALLISPAQCPTSARLWQIWVCPYF